MSSQTITGFVPRESNYLSRVAPNARLAYIPVIVGLSAVAFGVVCALGGSSALPSLFLQQRVWIPLISAGSVLTLLGVFSYYRLQKNFALSEVFVGNRDKASAGTTATSSSSSSANMPIVTVSSPNELFLQGDKPVIRAALNEHKSLIPVLANIIADYALGQFKAFNSTDWERFAGVRTDKLALDTEEFYKFWFAPDAEDLLLARENPNHQIRLNCDTHFPPILRPQKITPIISPDGQSLAAPLEIDLETLGNILQKPLEGHPSQFSNKSNEAFQQNKNTKAEPPCYLVARKEVFGRGFSIAQQRDYIKRLNEISGAGYEELPSALDLSTVALVHHVATGERYLGDATGMEKRVTYSHSQETVKFGQSTYPIVVGYQTPLVSGVVGGPGSSGGLHVDYYFGYDNDFLGVAGLRKFFGHRKLDA